MSVPTETVVPVLIHGVERWLTAGFLVIFGLLTIGVCTLNFPPGSFDLGGFKWTPFLIQFGAVAGYQISWAIYVSDYSRYLPPSVTVRKTFLWTYWGSALGAIWLIERSFMNMNSPYAVRPSLTSRSVNTPAV